jgi:hypothetical protein
MKTKICNHCKRSLPADKYHFYHNKRQKDGFESRCMECHGYDFKPTPSDPDNKICITCGTEYPNTVEFFAFRLDTRKLRGECNVCDGSKRRKYYDEHKEHKLAYNRERSKRLDKTDINFLLSRRIRQRVWYILNGYNKSKRSFELLGCDIETFKKYLEDQFTGEMNWTNYGKGDDKWHMDHDPPLASYDLTDPGQHRQAFHYTHIHPLWQKQNIAKGSVYNGERHYYRKPPKPLSK